MSITLTAKPQLRMLYVFWAFMECLLFGGLLYGWGSLVFILKDEGMYAYYCHRADNATSVDYTFSPNNETSDVRRHATSTPVSPTSFVVAVMNVSRADGYNVKKSEGCKEQDSILALVFTVASSLFCVGCAIMGHVNYKFGTRVTRICSMLSFVSGCLMVAFVSTDHPWLIFPGLTLVGIGGIPLLVTNTQISNLFTTGSSTVVGLLCGAFDCSAAVQLIVKIAYEKGFSRQHSYFVLIGLHSLVLVSTFLFLPKDFIRKPEPEKEREVVYKVEDEGQHGQVELLTAAKTIKLESGTVDCSDNCSKNEAIQPLTLKDPGKRSLKSCVISYVFLLHIYWLAILQLRFYFFLGTLNPWLNLILGGDVHQVSFFTNISLYFMLCGIVTSPLAGIVYDWQKRIYINKRSDKCRQLMPSVFPLAFTVLLSIILSLLVLIPMVEILYVTFIIMTCFRSFLYAIAAAFISSIFPSEYFGMLYGILIISGGVVSFCQFGLFQWAEVTDFQQVNIFLLVLMCTAFVHPAYQWYSSRRVETFTLQQEAQSRAH